MNKEIKARWLEALRSGDYKQGKGWLHQARKDETFYCCLGVLCDLHAKATGTQWLQRDLEPLPSGIQRYSYLGSSALLPHEVIQWAEILSAGFLPQSGSDLVKMNDSENCTFAEIADVIEKEL